MVDDLASLAAPHRCALPWDGWLIAGGVGCRGAELVHPGQPSGAEPGRRGEVLVDQVASLASMTASDPGHRSDPVLPAAQLGDRR
ncbi:MAG: hypothetical protein ACYCO3_13035 [Mycobacteriales bacterium]